MAGVRGPLFGLDASGSIGDAITFSKWKGRAYVRIKATPSNPQSPGQVSTRAMMKFLTQAWANIDPADQAAWETLAAAGNYSTFNAYVKFNMDRWTQFQSPQQRPSGSPDLIPVMGALTVTAGVRIASVSQAITTENDGWGVIVHASQTTGFTPTKTTVREVFQWQGDPTTGVISPLTPGVWYIRTVGISLGGTQTAAVAQQSVTVLS